MKAAIISIVIVLFLVFAGGSIYFAKQKKSVPVTLSSLGQITGNPNSKVTLTEFGDFQCPACKTFEPLMQKVRKDYGKKVKIVFKHFPLTQIHPNGMPSARAAEAASKQGKFWEYHDLLYEKQEEWSGLPDATQKFTEYAETLKLDPEKFQKDMNSKQVQDAINLQVNEAETIGVNATPTVYLNNTKISVRDYDSLKKLIDQALGT